MKLTIPALVLTIAASAAAAEDAGLRLAEIYMPHHDKEARVTIWYPGAGKSATKSLYADSPIFHGVEASLDAEIAPGTHPVVMFSHGMGGTDRAQAWLGAELARRGAIVVMVNHPNSTWGDFDMTEGVKHWTRAADLSTAMDKLFQDPVFDGHIDKTRVLASGFSYGGWTALSLGGMTGNLRGIVEACTTYRQTMEACDMFLSDEVSMQSQDSGMWNASYADPRITHVVAIEPGFVWGLDGSNTSALVPDATLIGLGDEQTRMLATNFEKSGLTKILPEARVLQVAPGSHFSVMPLCTSAGLQILAEEEDDPVCSDPSGTDRAMVHQEIIETISEAMGL